MLKNLLAGNEDSDFILIKDFFRLKGRGLFQAFMHQQLNRNCEIHLLSFKNPSDYILSNPTWQNKIICHDGFTDSAGWKNDDKIVHKFTHNTALDSYFKQYISNIHKEYVIGIDSLSSLILSKHVADICRMFKNLQRFCKKSDIKLKIIALFHNHSKNDFITECFDYLASTVISLTHSHKRLINCHICHTKNGKLSKEICCYQILNNLDVKIVESCHGNKMTRMEQKTDPMLGLTFKLELEEKEKVARDQLVLPYTKTSNESEIIYECDENDDVDEEDPDDDLNI